MLDKFRKKNQQDLTGTQEDANIEELTFEEAKVEELKNEAENMEIEAIQQHDKHYTDDSFWNKLQKFSKKAGSTIVYAVLILYYTMQKPEVPFKVKATIAGALGYFILPLDLIPDVAMGIGFVDDLSIITVALFQAAMYVDQDVKKQAKDKLTDWFGEGVDTSEIDNKLNIEK